MLNHITIQGRLTANPELRYTQSQVPVATFTVAVDRDFADSNGNRGVEFIPCVAWRGTGEFVNKWFQKGQMAVVSGRLQLRDYTNKDNIKVRVAEIVAENVYFCGKKEDNGSSGNNSSGYQTGSNNRGVDVYAPPEFEEIDDDDGELPF